MTQSERGCLQWVRTCYGVDLQGDRVVAVRGVRSRSGVNCTEVGEFEPSRNVDRVPCVGALSARESLMRWLEAPYRATEKAERVLPTLLDIQLPFALEDCVYSFLDIRRTPEDSTQALAVAARKEDIGKRLDAFRERGIDPVVLDHEGVALWSQSLLERPMPRGSRSVRALVHLNAERSTLVTGIGERILGVHAVKAGDTGQVIRMLHAQLGLNGDRSREFEWLWSGPGAGDRAMVSEMHRVLAAEWPGQSYVHEAPEYFLARALATRALVAGPLRCNLRGAEFIHETMARRIHQRALFTASIVLAAGILLCAANPISRMIANSKIRAADSEFRELADALAPGKTGNAKGRHALTIVRSELARESELLQPFLAAFEPSLGDLLLSVMTTGRKNGLQFEMISLGKDKVEIRGTAEDWNSFGELLSVLGLGERHLDRRDAGADERIPFSVVGDRRDAGLGAPPRRASGGRGVRFE